jgi:hypothetical protein
MNDPKFQFSNVVVVETDLIGVVVKVWNYNEDDYSYDIYIQKYSIIKNYNEDEIQQFVYSHEFPLCHCPKSLRGDRDKEAKVFSIDRPDLIGPTNGLRFYICLNCGNGYDLHYADGTLI